MRRRAWKKRLRRTVLMFGGLFLLFLGLDLAFPLPEEKPWSQVVTARDGTVLHAFLSRDEQWRLRTTVDEVPPELVTALIAKEARYFYRLFGVYPLAILRAAFSYLSSGRRVSGASTITMQVARLMEPKERTW